MTEGKTMKNTQKIKLQMAEKLIQLVLEEVGPQGLAIALNNVSSHGEGIEKAEWALDKKDILLGEWFAGIEKLMQAGKRIEKFTNGELVV